MKKIALLNTAIFSFNQGDYIIMESVKKQLSFLTSEAFVVEIATHSPMFHVRELGLFNKNSFYDKLQDIDYKFVCGTNLLAHNMHYRKTAWNINLRDTKHFGGAVLVGVGTCHSDEEINAYTRKLYKQALAADYTHSVRDERTKKMMEDMGYKVINTGCATMWGLTESHCEKIPCTKKNKVVFTLTDYAMDPKNDKKMIDILRRNYDELVFWPQGVGDFEYFHSLGETKDIQIISPLLENYSCFLTQNDCDFVGTRLHAGIKAMQMLKRSIIIGVDNRARDMAANYGLHLIERETIEDLEAKINGTFSTKMKIKEENIRTFLAQFSAK